MKKHRMELLEVAQALLKLDINSPPEEIQNLIEDGHFHLKWLRSDPCNVIQTHALDQRIRRAEFLLEQKEAVSQRR
ncbi:MAG: hypothetical protein NTX96_01375 [Candidatus Zambryskibacteria bacterium]|nr:hypothetical protein [Candidatus Zambryskibacteria bacterium]